MFVPVACPECGKPFQVPQEAVGQAAVCPWCQAAVVALPVGTPVPPASPRDSRPPARRAEPEPLPPDDLRDPPATKPFPWWVVGVALLALAAAAGVTVAVLRYVREQANTPRWEAFTPPDGAFSAELLARVAEDTERLPPGGKRFASESAGLTAWVGWVDLDPAQVRLAAADDAWQHFLKPFDAERDRLKEKTGGTVVREATTKFKDPLTREVRIEYDGGRAVERMMVTAGGRRPRMYFVGVAGRIDFDGPEVRRLFESFRANE